MAYLVTPPCISTVKSDFRIMSGLQEIIIKIVSQHICLLLFFLSRCELQKGFFAFERHGW